MKTALDTELFPKLCEVVSLPLHNLETALCSELSALLGLTATDHGQDVLGILS